MLEKEPLPKKENPKNPEVPTPTSEKNEARIDTAYSSSVARYFNGRQNRMREVKPEMNDSDVMLEQFLIEQQNTLSKLAHPEKIKKMQPTDVSFALAELSGTMARTNPESRYVNNTDKNLTEELIQEREDVYMETRKLYMESCKKMFPELEAGLIPSQLPRIIREIKKVDLFDLDGRGENPHIREEDFRISDIQKLLKENPKELLKRIDEALYWIGSQMQDSAYGRFEAFQTNEEGGEMEAVEKEEKRLGTLAGPVYKLQLIKDEILMKIYGRSDMRPSERMKFDKVRSRLDVG